jgi:two-component system chemotaxis response regulator CheY
VLVAGEQIAVERALLDAFRLRSFDVTCVRHGDEALHAFERRSFELVLADLAMDRGDGLALVPALRRVVGLEEIPVLVVDDRARPDLRDAARRVGAAGYLVRPIELARMEQHITQLIEAPRQRRFTRFHAAVPVRCLADGSSTVTCDIGRGGMQLRSEREVPAGTLERFEVVLAELGARLAVEAEVIHRRNEPGNDRRTLGLRFHHFADDGEAIWISFLASLAPTRRSRDPAR